jgi:hypothetical protein
LGPDPRKSDRDPRDELQAVSSNLTLNRYRFEVTAGIILGLDADVAESENRACSLENRSPDSPRDDRAPGHSRRGRGPAECLCIPLREL